MAKRDRDRKSIRRRDETQEVVCRCEEVPCQSIVEAIQNGARTLDAVKRQTRAGMGFCQGRTCRRLVSRLIVEVGGRTPGDLPPPTVRPPVRPLPLGCVAKGEDLL